MKKTLTILFCLYSVSLFSQNVGINTLTPNPKAALDIEATDKGILIPRLTTIQRNSLGVTLGTLHESLIVYDKDDSQFYYWDGINWSNVGGSTVVNTDNQNLLGATLTGSVLQIDIENGSPAVIDLASIQNDADNDPNNEIELPLSAITGQVLAWSGTAWVAQNSASGADNWGNQVVNTSGINLSGNGTAGLPLTVTEVDGSLTNEIQDISLSGSNLSISNGSTLDLSGLQNDADSDPTNEIELPAAATTGQVLAWNGTAWVAQNSASGADNWGNDIVNTSGTNISGNGTTASPIVITEVDGSVTNEIQDISLSGTNLSISSGSTLDLSILQDGTGTDNQSLSISGNNLSISNGNSIVLPSGADNWGSDVVSTSGTNISGNGTTGSPLTVTEVDGSITNEIQSLNLAGNSLSISGGNSITLPSGADNWGSDVVNTSGTNISGNGTTGSPLTITEVDGSVTNEIQNLTLTGNTLAISGGNTVTLTDTDPTNELQDISLTGTNLSLTNGSTIDLSAVGGGGSNTANTTPTVGASGVKMIKLVEADCQNDILGTAYIGADDNIWAHGHGAQYQYGVPGLTDNSFQPHIEPIAPINGARRGKWKHVFTDRNTLWAVTDSGEVYRRGQDYNGQLGNGTGAGALLYLTKMAYFENNNIKVKYLYVSPTTPNTNEGKAVYALTDNGDVYAWGRNGVGQLGIGNTTDQQSPLIITTLQGRNIVKMT